MRKNFYLHALVLGITLAALLARTSGVRWGLPFLYNPDEPNFVERSLRILTTGDLDPHWYGHPGSTTIYSLSLLYYGIFLTGLYPESPPNLAELERLYYQDPTIFHLAGRILFVCFGTATVLLTYMIARRLFDNSVAILSSALIAASPLHIDYSRLIRTDIMMSFFILITLFFCIRVREKGAYAAYSLAGLFAGVAIATKYPAVICLSLLPIAHFSTPPSQRPAIHKLAIAGLSCLLATFMASPFLFLSPRTVYRNLTHEARPMALAATGEGLVNNLVWYIQDPLLDALSFGGLILAVLGFIFYMKDARKDNWLLTAFPVLFLVFISSLTLRWKRWVIPLIPFFSMLAAYAWHRISRWFADRFSMRLGQQIALLLLLATFAPLLRADTLLLSNLTGLDTRTLARNWILQYVPEGSRILIESYTPQLPTGRYKLFVVSNSGILLETDTASSRHSAFLTPYSHIGNLRQISSVLESGIDYMITSDRYDLYVTDCSRFPEYGSIIKTYETLMSMGECVYEHRCIKRGCTGPIIRVYRLQNAHKP